MLDINKMAVVAFLITNKANQIKFFEKTFLMADISPKIIFGMFFFTLSNANIDFLR